MGESNGRINGKAVPGALDAIEARRRARASAEQRQRQAHQVIAGFIKGHPQFQNVDALTESDAVALLCVYVLELRERCMRSEAKLLEALGPERSAEIDAKFEAEMQRQAQEVTAAAEEPQKVVVG